MSAVFTATRANEIYQECKVVQKLIEAGAREERILESKFTAYAHLNNLAGLWELVEAVDVDALNYYGYTALMEACSQRKREAVSFLLSVGANPNIFNYKTALICAIYTHDIEIVKLLIENKADLNLMTINGDTAWSSSQASTPRMRSLLEEYLRQ